MDKQIENGIAEIRQHLWIVCKWCMQEKERAYWAEKDHRKPKARWDLVYLWSGCCNGYINSLTFLGVLKKRELNINGSYLDEV